MSRSSPHLLAPLLLLAACDPSAERGAGSAQGQGTGAVAGTVYYGGPDSDRPLSMDEPLCRGLHRAPVDSGVVERGPDGGLANVLVYVDWSGEGGGHLDGGPAPDRPVTIRQEGCLIEPRLATALVGQPVRFVNRDPTLHSLRLLADVNRDLARDLPFRDQFLEVRFEQPEVAIAVRCGVHSWARGWLAVLPHPRFAVTGTDGEFTIGGLDPGTYTLAFWHELLGTQHHTVRVSRGRTDRLEVHFE